MDVYFSPSKAGKSKTVVRCSFVSWRTLVLACRQLPSCSVLTWLRKKGRFRSFLPFLFSPSWDPEDAVTSKSICHLAALSPNTIALEVEASTYEFQGDTTQSIASNVIRDKREWWGIFCYKVPTRFFWSKVDLHLITAQQQKLTLKVKPKKEEKEGIGETETWCSETALCPWWPLLW